MAGTRGDRAGKKGRGAPGITPSCGAWFSKEAPRNVSKRERIIILGHFQCLLAFLRVFSIYMFSANFETILAGNLVLILRESIALREQGTSTDASLLVSR